MDREKPDILSQRFKDYRATSEFDGAPVGSGPFYDRALYRPVLQDMKRQYDDNIWSWVLKHMADKQKG